MSKLLELEKLNKSIQQNMSFCNFLENNDGDYHEYCSKKLIDIIGKTNKSIRNIETNSLKNLKIMKKIACQRLEKNWQFSGSDIEEAKRKIHDATQKFNYIYLHELQFLTSIKTFETYLISLTNTKDFAEFNVDLVKSQNLIKDKFNSLFNVLFDLVDHFIKEQIQNLGGNIELQKNAVQRYKGKLFKIPTESDFLCKITNENYLLEMLFILDNIWSSGKINSSQELFLGLMIKINKLRNQIFHRSFILSEENISTFYITFDVVKGYLPLSTKREEQAKEIEAMRDKFLYDIKNQILNKNLRNWITKNFQWEDSQTNSNQILDNEALPSIEEINVIKINWKLFLKINNEPRSKSNQSFLSEVVYLRALNMINLILKLTVDVLMFFNRTENWKNDYKHTKITKTLFRFLDGDQKNISFMLKKLAFFPDNWNSHVFDCDEVRKEWEILMEFRNKASHNELLFDFELYKKFLRSLDFFLSPLAQDESLKASVKLNNELIFFFKSNKGILSYEKNRIFIKNLLGTSILDEILRSEELSK